MLNSSGEAKMVDISLKGETVREAVAKGSVMMQPETLEQVKNASLKKGDVLAVARIAGINGREKSPRFYSPLHMIPIDSTLCDFDLTKADCIGITSTVKSTGADRGGDGTLTAVTSRH